MAQTLCPSPCADSLQTPPARKFARAHTHVPSYLYRKGNIYYFRYALPKRLREALGGTEIRLSLRTAYMRQAKKLADKLYDAVLKGLEGQQMLTLQEIKQRLALLVSDLAELQAATFESVKDSPVYGEPEEALSAQELCAMQKSLYQDTKRQKSYYAEWVADKCYHPLTDSCDEKQCAEILAKPFRSEYFFALYAERHAAFLRDRGYFSQEEIEENKAIIGKAFMQACLMFNDYVAADEEGNATKAQKILSEYINTAAPTGLEPIPQITPAKQKLLFSEAVDRYATVKVREQSWKERNVQDILGRLKNFIDIIGDKAIEDIDRSDMRTFVETLQKLPPNRTGSKQYAGKAIAEILEMPHPKKLNVATVNTILESVVSMLEWYVREGILAKNPAKGLQVKDNRQAIELRDPFSREELERIFAHPKFTQGKFKHASYFWLPLIGLFTGMRLEEIAQLHCTDLYPVKDSSLWAIDINDTGTDEAGHAKSLKNKNARRQIPLHPTLIELGLLDYHAHILKAEHIRLFPELQRSANTPKLGKQPGKQFRVVVNATLEHAEKKSFHSLRHTFADFYKQRGLQNDMFRQLYGHDIPELASKQYGSKFPAELLYNEVISQLDYDLDLSILKRSI